MKYIAGFLFFIIVLNFFVLPTQAQDSSRPLTTDAELANYDYTLIFSGYSRLFFGGNLVSFLTIMIWFALVLSGMIFVSLIVYAGYIWLTAAGLEEPINKAKSIITNAVVGLVIILSAYVISYAIIKAASTVILGTVKNNTQPSEIDLWEGALPGF